MRYRSNADYAAQTAHAQRQHDELRVHLQRLIVIAHRRPLSVSEQRTVALAMDACWMKPEDVEAIQSGDSPWPQTRSQ